MCLAGLSGIFLIGYLGLALVIIKREQLKPFTAL